MLHLDQRYLRSSRHLRVPRAAARVDPLTSRRRAAFVVCAVAIACALALPISAHAGWPLESAAPTALGFGATYTAADGTPAVHRGVDLVATAGSAVRAPLSGRVSFAGRIPGTGGGTVLAVTLVTASGSVTLLPLASASVKAGTELAEGDSVGTLDGAGDASSAGSHLHVGARKSDLYVDPTALMSAPAPAPAEAADAPQPGPAVQLRPAGVTAAAGVAPGGAGALAPAAGVPAPQPAAASALSAVAAGVSVGAPAGAVAPGASVAPGVSIPGAVPQAAAQGSTLQSVGEAFSAAVAGGGRDRSGQRLPLGALVEWVLGLAARGLQTGARVLVGALLALGALWPIWRSERRKGAVQLSVRPVGDDVAAVTGR